MLFCCCCWCGVSMNKQVLWMMRVLLKIIIINNSRISCPLIEMVGYIRWCSWVGYSHLHIIFCHVFSYSQITPHNPPKMTLTIIVSFYDVEIIYCGHVKVTHALIEHFSNSFLSFNFLWLSDKYYHTTDSSISHWLNSQ